MDRANLSSFLSQADCRVVAVCDVSGAARQKARDQVNAHYGDQGCAVIADWRELIARKDIDAVMIATPDHWHSLIATAAAKAGKDMYCEKPMGVSLTDGQAIRDAVRRHQRVFQAGTWQRSAEKFRYACELASNGHLGKIHTIEVATDGTKFTAGYKGWIRVDRHWEHHPGLVAEPASLLKMKLRSEEQHLYKSNNHVGNFLECVRSRKDPISDVEATHKASYLALLTVIAGRLEQKLKWDPQHERFIGNDEANCLSHQPMHNGWAV